MQDKIPHLTLPRKTILGIQFLFVAFGATVLVPLLVGISPSIALLTAGVGTLIFHHLITRGKVPVFLGSSFAFIAPIIEATRLFGFAGTLSGIIAVGIVYTVMSAIVKWRGPALIDRVFPSVVIGPVIMVIGLSLATEGVKMAVQNWPLALTALFTGIIVVVYARGSYPSSAVSLQATWQPFLPGTLISHQFRMPPGLACLNLLPLNSVGEQ
jgi:uracil permease